MQQNDSSKERRFIFPAWANYLLPVLAVMGIGGATYVPILVGIGFSAKTLNVGYAPEQPVPLVMRCMWAIWAWTADTATLRWKVLLLQPSPRRRLA